jgi:transposase
LRNKVSQMLMESGVVYNKQKLHKVGYFKELMETNPDISRAEAATNDLPRNHRADRQDRECIDSLPAP